MTTGHSCGPRQSRPRSNNRPIGISAVARVNVSRWVRVTCPSCGIVRVRADRVVLRNCADDCSWSYRAICSNCDSTFVDATPTALALPAVAAGLAVETWTLPRPSARRGGERFTAVDALELHLALLEDDWLDELRRVEPGTPG